MIAFAEQSAALVAATLVLAERLVSYVLRTMLIAVAMLLASTPGAALAAALRLGDTGLTATTVRGDGAQRLALAVGDGPVSVLDTRTQTFATIATPAGCSFADIHHATLLWNCPTLTSFAPHGITHEIATGRVAVLAPLNPYGSEESVRYATIGERFARISVSGYHYSDQSVYVDRATGAQSYRPVRFGTVRDLDAPTLTRRLCQGYLEPQVESDIGLQPGDPVVAGRWSAAMTLMDNPALARDNNAASYIARMQLQRCGGRARTIRVCRTVTCSQPVLDDRIVAWSEMRGRGPTTSRLVVRWLRSGRVRRTAWQTPALTPVLVDHRLYAHEGPVPSARPASIRGRLLRAAL